MKTFYGGTFINEEKLKESQINHPIKLEYYKVIDNDIESIKRKSRFGVNIVKTEYIDDDIKVEEKEIRYISNDENKINNILEVLKENEVTPIGIEDVMLDLSSKYLFL